MGSLPTVSRASAWFPSRHGGSVASYPEQRARGAVERTYILRQAAAQLNPDENAALTADDHRHAFMAFVAGLLADEPALQPVSEHEWRRPSSEPPFQTCRWMSRSGYTEHPVCRLTYPQDVASLVQLSKIAVLVVRTIDDDQDVDDGLSGRAGTAADPACSTRFGDVAQRVQDSNTLDREPARPSRFVVQPDQIALLAPPRPELGLPPLDGHPGSGG
jgi:hypothetical protein